MPGDFITGNVKLTDEREAELRRNLWTKRSGFGAVRGLDG